jgi:NodT family efflux transporter outer membrane factor (OMF) lipoprotein
MGHTGQNKCCLPCILALFGLLALTACSSFLEEDRPVPTVNLPDRFQPAAEDMTPPEVGIDGAADAQAAPDDIPLSRWWRAFRSDELNGLVDRALANSHDLKVAIARVQQAQAQIGIAAGTRLPTIGIAGQSLTDAPNGGVGTRFPSPFGQTQRLEQFGVTASYEFDFWGKNLFASESARAGAQASIYDRQTIALTLVAGVVSTYFQYLESNERIVVALANVDNITRVLAVVKKRRQIGEGADLEVRQQATELAQARATVPPLLLQRAQFRNQLAILIGELPESLTLSKSFLRDVHVPKIPPSLPSELLARRPDLRSAQAGVLAAAANVGQARAQLFPDFTINAERGVGGNYFATLLNPASYFYLISANVAQTVFDNGKSLSQIDQAKAILAESVESYRQAVLTALRDVENALVAVQFTRETEIAQIDAVENANAAFDLSQSAFRNGNTDYLTMLDTERTQYQTEDQKVTAHFDRLNAALSLFQSLGGGTDPSEAP